MWRSACGKRTRAVGFSPRDDRRSNDVCLQSLPYPYANLPSALDVVVPCRDPMSRTLKEIVPEQSTESATTGSRRLERCPICDYRLMGLPEIHRCPECAFEYDKRMQVVVQSSVYACYAALLSLFFGGFVMMTRYWGNIYTWVAFASALVFGKYALRFFRGNFNKVIIWELGILLIKRGRLSNRIARERIGSIEFDTNSISIIKDNNTEWDAITVATVGSARRLLEVELLTRHYFGSLCKAASPAD